MEFMDGVTFLKECTKLSDEGIIVSNVVRLAAIALLLIILRVGVTWSRNKDSDIICVVGAVLGVIIFIVGRFLLDIIIPQNFQEPNGKYNVVIDANADMNEFFKRYEIVDSKDGIYTITLKDSSEVQEDEIY